MMEMGRCDSQFCAWIDTADSRDRQQEHRYQERIRERVFLDCLHIHTSSAELSSAIEQGLAVLLSWQGEISRTCYVAVERGCYQGLGAYLVIYVCLSGFWHYNVPHF